MPIRRFTTAVYAASVVLALGAVGIAGATSASAATTGPRHAAPTHSGAVLVKEEKTANGIVEVYKWKAPPQHTGSIARPDTGSGCNGIDPEVCFTVDGAGYYVDWAENDTYYGHTAWTNMQMRTPAGTVFATASFTASGGYWYYIDWEPYDYEPGGWWCGLSNVNNGAYTGECVDVHN